MLKQIQKLRQLAIDFFLLVSFSLLAIAWSPAIASSAPIVPHSEELVHAVQEIEALDGMRIDKTDIRSSIQAYPRLEMALDKYLMAIPSGYYTIASVEGLKSLLDNPQTVLVDVRELSEYQSGHIPDAIDIPLRTLTHNLNKIPHDRPVVLYCSSGYRSAMGVMTLHLLGYDNVQGFPPSFLGWKTSGEAIAKS